MFQLFGIGVVKPLPNITKDNITKASAKHNQEGSPIWRSIIQQLEKTNYSFIYSRWDLKDLRMKDLVWLSSFFYQEQTPSPASIHPPSISWMLPLMTEQLHTLQELPTDLYPISTCMLGLPRKEPNTNTKDHNLEEKLTLRLFFCKTSQKFRDCCNRSAVGLAQDLLVPAGECVTEKGTNSLVSNPVVIKVAKLE